MVGKGMVGKGMVGKGMVGKGMVGKGMVGKGMVGKGMVGKGMVGKGMVGKGMVGKGMVGKGMAGKVDVAFARRRTYDHLRRSLVDGASRLVAISGCLSVHRCAAFADRRVFRCAAVLPL